MRLLAITPGDDRQLAPWLEAVGRAGLRQLLIREPQRSADDLARITDEALRWVPTAIVHERCADAWHIAEARGLAVHRRRWSCHDGDELDAAFAAHAPYALLSPVWRPTSKPADDRAPLGFGAFARLAAGRPVYALGGVLPAHCRVLREIDAHGVAVLGGIFGAASARAAAARVRAYLE